MPRKNPAPIKTVIELVRAVSPEFARVAELATFGLHVQDAMDTAGYELRKKSQPKAAAPVVTPAVGVGQAQGVSGPPLGGSPLPANGHAGDEL